MNQREFADIVLNDARAYAAGMGYQFGPGADTFVESQLLQAGRETENAPPAEQQRKLDEARRAARILINSMIAQIDQIAGYRAMNPGKIGEETRDAALSSGICPLWPFC
jgi:hypothetical protein